MKVINILIKGKVTEFRFAEDCFEGYYITPGRDAEIVFYVSGHEFHAPYDAQVENELLRLITFREAEKIRCMDKLAEEIYYKTIDVNDNALDHLRHVFIAMQQYHEAKLREKQNKIPDDVFALVQEWFYKLSIGQATQGEIADVIESFYEAKLKEELIKFAKWIREPSYIHVYAYDVDEYLKQRKDEKRTDN